MEDAAELKIEGIDKLLKALKGKPPTGSIGILSSAPRSSKSGKGGSPTNAEVGAAHEFGSPARGLPIRSFLRVPLTTRLGKELDKNGVFSRETFDEVLKQGSMAPWLKKVMVVSESVVLGAFDTGGYGNWPAWKIPGYQNNTGQILLDTQQLRNSISSEVIE